MEEEKEEVAEAPPFPACMLSVKFPSPSFRFLSPYSSSSSSSPESSWNKRIFAPCSPFCCSDLILKSERGGGTDGKEGEGKKMGG